MQIFLGGVSFSFRLTPQFLVSTLEGISGEPEPGGWLVGAWAGRGALPRLLTCAPHRKIEDSTPGAGGMDTGKPSRDRIAPEGRP